MKRSHPPTLIKTTQRTLRDEIALTRNARVVVATSGGPDSMALLDVLAHLSDRSGEFTITAHGIDHGLRPEANAELDLAETHAKALGVAFTRSRVRVARGGNLQARAREARHAALEKARVEARAELIATAHHASDRAETVLMRILRGSGAAGLAVLPPRDGTLIRPFIRAERADIDLHLDRHRVPFARDPSNLDRHFLRVRVRHEILPLLAAIDPAITLHLCAIADDLAEFRDESASTYRIPRAARLALARLAAAPKARMRDAVVLLPGGLIAAKAAEQTTEQTKKREGARPLKNLVLR